MRPTKHAKHNSREPHPHTLRHTFLTHSGEAGVNLFTLMAVGGQKNVRAAAM